MKIKENISHSAETLELERIESFQDSLRGLGVTALQTEVDMALRHPEIAAQRAFANTDFRAEPTLYLSPEVAEDLGETTITGFTPYVSRAGKGSAHGVFFGALSFDDGSEVAVAVKPHFVNEGDSASRLQAEASCMQDYFTNVAAKQAGFESLRPVGFILNHAHQPYSITVLDESLTSLDSIDWTHFYEEDYETTGMRELLYKTSQITALVHDCGDSYQGDLAFRNIATNIDGHVFLFDWEKGTVSEAPSVDLEARFGNTLQDILGLMRDMVRPARGSIPGVGLFENCREDMWAEFKDIFFDDYVEARLHLAQQGSHHMARLKDTKEELTQLEHFLQSEMAQWQQMLDRAFGTRV